LLPEHDVPNEGEPREYQQEHYKKMIQVNPGSGKSVRQLAQLVLKLVELEKKLITAQEKLAATEGKLIKEEVDEDDIAAVLARWIKVPVEKLTQDGKVAHWGVSVNRWEPNNCLQTLRTGHISSVQVIYNIFDQNPEDSLFPLCKELDVAIIARVPFDEGTLTGTMSYDTTFPADDWRSTYFVPENLISSVDHANALKSLIPNGMDMPEMALRFILSNPDVGTIIPGMRKINHAANNIACSDGNGLSDDLLEKLKLHRWDRQPTEWSQ
jgi:hypothetical protein